MRHVSITTRVDNIYIFGVPTSIPPVPRSETSRLPMSQPGRSTPLDLSSSSSHIDLPSNNQLEYHVVLLLVLYKPAPYI